MNDYTHKKYLVRNRMTGELHTATKRLALVPTTLR